MHFSAKLGIAIACRLSVRPSVCLSVCLSVTLVNCDHIGWNSSKIISSLVSLGCSLFATLTWRVCSKGNTPKFWPKVTHPLLIWASETFDRKLRCYALPTRHRTGNALLKSTRKLRYSKDDRVTPWYVTPCTAVGKLLRLCYDRRIRLISLVIRCQRLSPRDGAENLQMCRVNARLRD